VKALMAYLRGQLSKDAELFEGRRGSGPPLFG